jgi:undecaprenyl diphosphate synthase
MNTGCFGKSGRQAVPRHIRLILDGNRRYGQRQHLTDPQDAMYMAGANKLDDLLKWGVDLGISGDYALGPFDRKS